MTSRFKFIEKKASLLRCHKLVFEDKSQAMKHKKILQRKHGKKFKVYLCDWCNNYHLTTMEI